MSEESRLPGTNVDLGEMPPNQGMTIGAMESADLKDGDVIYMMVKKPNQVRAVNQAFKLVRVVVPGKKPGESKVEFRLQQVEAEEPEEEKNRRREIARAIVAKHKDEIMAEAVAATEEALARKPADKLEKMRDQSDKGAKAKVTSKRGCMFLTIGEEETLL